MVKEKLYAKIEFNSEEKEIIIPSYDPSERSDPSAPSEYDLFVGKICKILKINTDDPNSVLEFKYKDNDEDEDDDGPIQMNSLDDYERLLRLIREEGIEITINIELKENANLDVNTCTQNFIKYQEEKRNKNEVNKDDDNKNIDNSNIDNSNMNILNTENDNFIILNVKMDNNNNKSVNNNKNKINEANNTNNKIDFSKEYITFLETCDLCYKYPIINIVYYCLKCSYFICDNCERDPDINHRHTFLKVQTKEQYIDLNKKINNNENGSKSKINQMCNGITNLVKTIRIKEPLLLNLLQIARKRYNLKNIDNNILKEALIKANGDIDKAILFLQK